MVPPIEAVNSIPVTIEMRSNYDIKSKIGKQVVHFVDNWSHWSRLMKVLSHSLSYLLFYLHTTWLKGHDQFIFRGNNQCLKE